MNELKQDLTIIDIVNIEQGRHSWWDWHSVWGEPKFLTDVMIKARQYLGDFSAAIRESTKLANRSETFRNIGCVALAIELVVLPIFVLHANPRPIDIGIYGSILGYTGNYAHSQHSKKTFYETLADRLNNK